MYKSNESFSGKGHNAHICKKCAALTPEERSKEATLTRLLNLSLTMSWILKKRRKKMKKTVLVFMSIITMLTGCNKVETSPNETINETNMSETTEISEEALDRIPFEVLIDKPSLESGKEKETTVIIVTDIEDWDYTVSSENGKISNKEENSFVYTVPKDESEREDTITIQLSDNENRTSYEYTIPLIFANSIPQ